MSGFSLVLLPTPDVARGLPCLPMWRSCMLQELKREGSDLVLSLDNASGRPKTEPTKKSGLPFLRECFWLPSRQSRFVFLQQGRCAASPATSPMLFPSSHLLSKAFNVAMSKRDRAQLRHLAQHEAWCHLGCRKSDYCKRCLLAKEMCPNGSEVQPRCCLLNMLLWTHWNGAGGQEGLGD